MENLIEVFRTEMSSRYFYDSETGLWKREKLGEMQNEEGIYTGSILTSENPAFSFDGRMYDIKC